MGLHHKIRHHITKYHRMRKKKEEDLSSWKEDWYKFNEKKFGWLEKLVEKLLPWLVLLLLVIILGEFSHELNFFHWQWMEQVADFFHHYHNFIVILDQVIIGFFVVDIYFNFFRKATIGSFLKTSILDIIAVAPLGLLFKISGIGEAQSILHVTEDLGKEASRVIKEGEVGAKLIKEGEVGAKLIKAEQEAAKLARLQKMQKLTKGSARAPRFLRLYKLREFFKRKK